MIPEACRIENNQFVRLKGGVSVVGAKPDREPPLDRFTFKPNTYAGNLLYGGKNSFAEASVGFQEMPVPSTWVEAEAIAAFKPITPAEVGPEWVRMKRL